MRKDTSFSAEELVSMQLNLLPTTRQAIEWKAKNENWSYQTIKSRGRNGTKRMFLFSGLPKGIQEAIRQKQVGDLLQDAQAKPLPALQNDLFETVDENNLTDRQRQVAAARKGVLKAIEDVMEQANITQSNAIKAILTQAKLNGYEHIAKMLELALDKKGSAQKTPSLRTIERWFVARDEAKSLAPVIPVANFALPKWAGVFLKYYQQPQKPSVAAAYELFLNEWQQIAPLEKLPTFNQAKYLLKKLGNVSREKGRMGSREIKNIKPYKVRDFLHLNPTDIYTADGHTFDAEVLHPDSGKPFRPEITTIADVATRKIVGWSVDLAESGLAVLSAISHACESNGIAAIFYVDNGGGYKNAMMTDEATGLMGRLGMTMHHSIAYNSQARGVIERLHQSVWVKAAQSLQTYMGAKMDRQAAQSVHKASRQLVKKGVNLKGVPALANIQSLSPNMLMDWAEFTAFCEWHVEQYNNRPHRSLPKILDVENTKRHMTPNEYWALKVEQGAKVIRIEEDEKHMLFMPQVMRVVQRGQVFLRNNRYFSMALEEYHGDSVRVAYDIHDAEHVWIYDDVGRLICKAQWNANSTAYMPVSVIEQSKDKRIDMQVKRLEAKKQTALAARPFRVIEHQATVDLGGMHIDMASLAERGEQARLRMLQKSQKEAVVEAEIVPTIVEEVALEEIWSVPSEPADRFALYERLKDKTDLPQATQKWVASYPKSHEFKALMKRQANSQG